MANIQEFYTVIKLNDQEAKNTLEQLKKKVDDLKAARDKAIAAGSDSNFIKDLNKELKSARAELKAYDTNVRKTISTLDNLSASSVSDIEKAMRSMMKIQKEATNPDDWNRMQVYIDKCRERIEQFKQGIHAASNETDNLSKVMSNIKGASLNELNQAKNYLEGQIADMSPDSMSYSTAVNQLQEVKARIQQVNAEQTKMVSLIEKYDRETDNTRKDMQSVQRETALVEKTLKNISGASIRDLDYSLKIVTERMKGLDRGSQEFKDLTQQAKKFKAELERINNEQREAKSVFSRGVDFFNRNWGVITQAIATFSGLSFTIRKAVSEYAKMEDALASTRKYTGMADDAVRNLNEDFKKMDTRTAREQLNEYAGIAGRLGVTSEDAVKEFVDGADKIQVALGDDLGEDAVATIGKLTMAFGEDKRMGLRGAMLATGSAVNTLSQTSSASAGYMVDFTSRLAGMGLQADIAQTNIMGYASVLDQNMQQAEMASTAMGQLITAMFKDPAKFAKLAGQNVKAFTNLLRKDANQAILTFLASMRDKGGFSELAPMFDDMGLSGQRCVGVLSTMASKLDDVKKAQEIANVAYSDGTSVISEFNTMNNTANAKLDKAKKHFAELAIELGEKLMPVASMTISSTSLLVRGLSRVISFALKMKTTLITLTSVLVVYTIATKGQIAVDKLHVLWNTKVITSLKALKTAMMENPYTATAVLVLAIVAAYQDWFRTTNEVTSAQKGLRDVQDEVNSNTRTEINNLNELVKIAKDKKNSDDERREAIRKLNEISPEYLGNLNLENINTIEATNSVEAYTKALVLNAKAKALAAKIQDVEDRKNKVKNSDNSSIIDFVQTGINNVANFLSKGGNAISTLMTNGNLSGWDMKTSLEEEGYAFNNMQAAIIRTNNSLIELNKEQKIYQKELENTIKEQNALDAKNRQEDNSEEANNPFHQETEKEKKERLKREKAEERERARRAAAALKAKKEADKADKAETDRQLSENALKYAKGLIDYRTFMQERERIQLEGIQKRKTHWDKESNEYKGLLNKEEELTMKHDEEMLNMNLRDIERQRQATAVELEKSFYDKNSEVYLNEDALNEALYQNDVEAMQKRLKLFSIGSEDWLNTKDELERMEQQHQLDNERTFQERLRSLRENYGKTDVEELHQIELAGLEELHKKKLLKEEEYLEMKKNLERHYELEKSREDVKNSAGEQFRKRNTENYEINKNKATADYESQNGEGTSLGNFLTSDWQIFAGTWANIKKMEEEGVISHQEAMAQMADATADLAKGMAEKMQAAYDSISSIMSGMSSYYSAVSEYEVTVTEKKYQKQIDAAGNNSAKKKKLEEKQQKEIARIKSKYAKKQAAMQIAQAIAQSAISAINAYSSAMAGVPYPANMVLAPVAAGIALAAGAIQIATIKKQQQAQEAGYYSGGFTGGKRYRKEAGVVHEGEFVANHAAVNNTRILPAFQLIDQAQRNNTIGSLTAEDVSRSLGNGGSTVISAPTVMVQNHNEELNDTLNNTNLVVNELKDMLGEGIYAKVSLDDLEREWKHRQHLKNNK